MSDASDRRNCERHPLRARVDLRRANEQRHKIDLEDFSASGCRIALPQRLLDDERIWVTLPGLNALQATVCWSKEWLAGASFDQPIHPAVFEMTAERLRRAA